VVFTNVFIFLYTTRKRGNCECIATRVEDVAPVVQSYFFRQICTVKGKVGPRWGAWPQDPWSYTARNDGGRLLYTLPAYFEKM